MNILPRHAFVFIALAAATVLIPAATLHAATSFNNVHNVVFETPPAPQTDIEAQEQSIYLQQILPQYNVSVSNFIIGGINYLFQDSQRTLSETADFYPRIEKRVHSNGICFSGTWKITENTPYSGYFKKDSTGLIIARASTALSETRRGQSRAFGFAGKLFPTLNPDLAVETANFFLVDVLMGAQRKHYLDVKMTNQPATGFRFSVLYLAYVASRAFSRADRNAGFRPLYPVSELGLTPGEQVSTPKYMMLQASDTIERNEAIDFRDELNMEANGYNTLTFDIMVSDTTANKSSPNWSKIGMVKLTDSEVSYGCDRQLHFAHPKIK